MEFYAKGKEYDYDIEKSTGKILSSDFDIENYTPGNGNSGNANNGASGTVLSLDKARSLALARVPGATEKDIRIQLDRDDGRQVYEGEIYSELFLKILHIHTILVFGANGVPQ